MKHRNFTKVILLLTAWVAVTGSAAIAETRLGGAARALFQRGGQAAGAVVCTVVAGPVAASSSSRESDVLCLDTTIQMRVVWIRFSSSDRPRVDKSVTLGSTVTVRNSSGIIVDGQSVSQANSWKSRRAGNPARSDFLTMDSARLPLLAWALRGDSAVAAHFRLSFHPVAEELHMVRDLFENLGHDVPGLSSDPVPMRSAGPPIEKSLATCRDALLRTRDLANDLRRLGSDHDPDDHHGDIDGLATRQLLAIDGYFDEYP